MAKLLFLARIATTNHHISKDANAECDLRFEEAESPCSPIGQQEKETPPASLIGRSHISGEDGGSARHFTDACVQTCDLGPRLCSYICDSAAESSKPLIFGPMLTSGVFEHDYLKQGEADYVVNATHDYYSRTCAPEKELEHSYAVHVAEKINCAEKESDDTNFHEEIANLEQHMGLNPSFSALTQPVIGDSVLEESIADVLLSDHRLGGNNCLGSMAGDLSLIEPSLDTALQENTDAVETIELKDADFDDLMKYLNSGSEIEGFEFSDFLQSSQSDKETPMVEAPLETSEQFNTAVANSNSKITGKFVENVPKISNLSLSHGKSSPKEISRPNSSSLTPRTKKKKRNKRETPEELRIFECCWEDCEDRFAVQTKLAEHLSKDHMPMYMRGADRICRWRGCERNEPFDKRYMLVRHIRTHTKEKPYQCTVCGGYFGTSDKLTIHMRRHLNKAIFPCRICDDKMFVSSGDRIRHEKSHNKTFPCGLCKTHFKIARELSDHVKLEHS